MRTYEELVRDLQVSTAGVDARIYRRAGLFTKLANVCGIRRCPKEGQALWPHVTENAIITSTCCAQKFSSHTIEGACISTVVAMYAVYVGGHPVYLIHSDHAKCVLVACAD